MESTIDERNDIDRTTIDRYNSLTHEWQSAEHIVMQIDLQHSLHRKNSKSKPNDTNENANPSSTETALTSIKNVLASIPEKISLPNFGSPERKDSNASNDVFFDVRISSHLHPFSLCHVFCFSSKRLGIFRTYSSDTDLRRR